MAYGKHVNYDVLREVLFGAITSSYVAIGSPLTVDARIVIIANSTDKDLYLSLNGTSNIMRIPAGSSQIHEYVANEINDTGFFLNIGAQFYVKQSASGAPTTGAIAVTVIYSVPGP